jgi:hypothetical protein
MSQVFLTDGKAGGQAVSSFPESINSHGFRSINIWPSTASFGAFDKLQFGTLASGSCQYHPTVTHWLTMTVTQEQDMCVKPNHMYNSELVF